MRRQHGVITRAQLLELGYRPGAINRRLHNGRLHRVWPGVYAVGRPRLTRHGHWLAAVLACGPEAFLSHETAAALWGIRPRARRLVVSVPSHVARRRAGVVVHRRGVLDAREVTTCLGIPVTSPVATLIDIAPGLTRDELEAAINEADKRDLIDPEQLRAALDELRPRPGIKALRQTLDRRTFRETDSGTERRFLRIVRRARLPLPETRRWVNDFKVDFYWPDLGLVVETDGLRYHRTPAEQARDRVRDQTHAAAGLSTLRFTRAQIRFEPDHVRDTLVAVVRRLGSSRPAP